MSDNERMVLIRNWHVTDNCESTLKDLEWPQCLHVRSPYFTLLILFCYFMVASLLQWGRPEIPEQEGVVATTSVTVRFQKTFCLFVQNFNCGAARLGTGHWQQIWYWVRYSLFILHDILCIILPFYIINRISLKWVAFLYFSDFLHLLIGHTIRLINLLMSIVGPPFQ